MRYKNLAYSWAYALLNPNSRTKHLWQIPKFNSIKSSVQKTQINSIRKKNLFQIRIPFGVQIRKRKNIFLIKKIPFVFAIVSMLQRFNTLPPQVTILSPQLWLSHGWTHDSAQWYFSLLVCLGPLEFLWLV